MLNRQTLKWIASLSASAAFALVLADACLTPADHDIHSAGAIVINVQRTDAIDIPSYFSGALRPSQSLTDIRCQVWRARRSETCPDDATLARELWPQLQQTPKTLYVGLQYPTGYLNVEYLASDRKLIIHSHFAQSWVSIPSGARGVMAIPTTSLYLVPTDVIFPGMLGVVRDDRIEHLIGDQTTETELGTVTIT